MISALSLLFHTTDTLDRGHFDQQSLRYLLGCDDACTDIAGVEYVNQESRAISWFNTPHISILDIRWMPQSARFISIRHVKVRSQLETRCLPAHARYICLGGCSLSGSVELRTLPPKLQEINLYKNEITGAIILTHLPAGIRNINVQYNSIEQVFYDKDLLPGSLRSVLAYSIKNKVKCISADETMVDVRVNKSLTNHQMPVEFPFYVYE